MIQLVKTAGDAHEELELVCSYNASLFYQMVDYTSSTLEAVSRLFEKALDQVEYFHRPMALSREHIWSDQAVVVRKIVSL